MVIKQFRNGIVTIPIEERHLNHEDCRKEIQSDATILSIIKDGVKYNRFQFESNQTHLRALF